MQKETITYLIKEKEELKIPTNLVETDILEIINSGLKKRGTTNISLVNSDGYHYVLDFSFLVEGKNINLSEDECSRVISQLIVYAKAINNLPQENPSLLVGVLKDFCFILETKNIEKYFHDERIPTSSARKLYDDTENNYKWLRYDIKKEILDFNKITYFENKETSVDDIYNYIEYCFKSGKLKINKKVVSMKNLSLIYREFKNTVLSDQEKYNFNQLKVIFYHAIILGKYHVDEKIMITTVDNIIYDLEIIPLALSMFISKYDFPISNKETLDNISSEFDDLSEDKYRRATGEYYTPIPLAEFLYEKYILPYFEGIDINPFNELWWWDTCCATQNLTNHKYGYAIERLYCSNLFKDDFTISKENNINAIKFQLDFLNDDLSVVKKINKKGKITVDKSEIKKVFKNMQNSSSLIFHENSKIPVDLILAMLQNKNIHILQNPPMSTPGGYNEKERLFPDENDITKLYMKEDPELARVNSELYINFLYRILFNRRYYKNDNQYVSTFLLGTFFTGFNNRDFRNLWFNYYKMEKGVMFPATVFPSLTDDFVMCFCIFSPKEETSKYEFEFDLYDKNLESNGKIKLYNCDEMQNCLKERVVSEVTL